ncbi:H(+)/Cl(-) exchange transporter ClcA [mine drainage metagenome]|uniref:H(+)/Cl(-) exchange transporter ClcA n=1 Tax=mine drainage metagenome TaxID=410659 RepID=A0A1J5RHY0_9ZZZZ
MGEVARSLAQLAVSAFTVNDTNESPNPSPDAASDASGFSAFSTRTWVRRGRARGRRLFLRYGLPWGAALIVGLVAVLYARWSEDAYELFLHWIDGRAWLAFLITPAMTMLAVYLTRRWFSGSEGSGIPQVIAALHAPPDDTLMSRLFGLRVIVGKLGVSLIGFLGGLTIGREGPTVHLGAAIMAETRRFYPHQGRHLERALLLAGAAAGLSGAFNTPLAGVIFAIEELARDFESRTNGVMITAVVFSGLTSLALAGNYLYFGQIVVPNNFHVGFTVPVIVASILCGLSGAAFNWALLRWEVWMPAPLRGLRANKPVMYALVIGLAVAALGVLTHGQTWGSGYDQARNLLDGKTEVSGFFALTKWLAMVISYMSGMPGGLFSPSLSIGAGLAQWMHWMFASAAMPTLIALCMAGYLAAVTQSPLTSFVIVMEMTNGTGMMIPMMAVALASSRISNMFTPPLYEALAEKNYFGLNPGTKPAQAPA